MKNIFIAAILFSGILPTTALHAQNTNSEPQVHRAEIGLRFLPTFSSFSLETSSSGTVKGELTPGFGFGGLIGVNISKFIGVQVEVLYNSLSQKYKDQNINRRLKVNYLNVPLLVTFNSNKARRVNFTAVVGPQIGFNLGSNISSASGTGSDTLKTVIALKQSDLGVAYGAGIGVMINKMNTMRFDIGYRGVYGFININKETVKSATEYTIKKADVRTNAAYLGITLLF